MQYACEDMVQCMVNNIMYNWNSGVHKISCALDLKKTSLYENKWKTFCDLRQIKYFFRDYLMKKNMILENLTGSVQI